MPVLIIPIFNLSHSLAAISLEIRKPKLIEVYRLYNYFKIIFQFLVVSFNKFNLLYYTPILGYNITKS